MDGLVGGLREWERRSGGRLGEGGREGQYSKPNSGNNKTGQWLIVQIRSCDLARDRDPVPGRTVRGKGGVGVSTEFHRFGPLRDGRRDRQHQS